MVKMSNTENNLTRLMEMCLKEKQYDIMEKTLNRISPTYSKFEYYSNKLEEARREETNGSSIMDG